LFIGRALGLVVEPTALPHEVLIVADGPVFVFSIDGVLDGAGHVFVPFLALAS